MTKAFRIVLVSIFCLAAWGVSGQNAEGRIRYLVVNNWTKQMSALDYISKQTRERNAYMWGNRSEWKVYRELFYTADETKYQDSEEKAEPDDDDYSWRKEVFFLKRNFKNRTLFETCDLDGKNYLVEDTLRAPDWKVMNDVKEIAGHVCMNAVMNDTIKKQKILVWFALDLPMSGGPERLYGLPGMILEADYNDGAMVVTADKIEVKKLTTEMDVPKKLKGKKIKQAEYLILLHKYIQEKRKEERPWFWGMRYG